MSTLNIHCSDSFWTPVTLRLRVPFEDLLWGNASRRWALCVISLCVNDFTMSRTTNSRCWMQLLVLTSTTRPLVTPLGVIERLSPSSSQLNVTGATAKTDVWAALDLGSIPQGYTASYTETHTWTQKEYVSGFSHVMKFYDGNQRCIVGAVICRWFAPLSYFFWSVYQGFKNSPISLKSPAAIRFCVNFEQQNKNEITLHTHHWNH